MSGGIFNDMSEVYESIINWPKRLAHEEPFYRRIFERIGARRVVDVACGTGHHAAMFHVWGLEVEGADISPSMIARARAAFGEPPGLRWTVRGYDQPMTSQSMFDAVVCVGNSLALAKDRATVHESIRQMLAGTRPGGAVVLQVLNVWALPDGPCVWQKDVRTTLQDRPALIIKGVHRCGDRAFVDVLVGFMQGDAKLQSECVPMLGLEAADLEHMMRQHGADRVSVLGGYQDQPYDRGKSTDLVIVAEKQPAR